MIARLFFLLMVAQLVASPAWPDSSAHLAVSAEPAVVPVKPLAEGRKLIRLPTLEFHLHLEADCAEDYEIRSVSISVADSRTTFSGEDVAGFSATPISFSVPARQLSPVAIDGFCSLAVGADDRETREDHVIPDAVTAHLSLRCAGEDAEAITYISHALDVVLQCAARADAQGGVTSTTPR